ncbi:NAF1-domain-containing protein, partial [Panus rudis PR-1116 ss-1]
FKMPSVVPQDLQLIQEMIGDTPIVPQRKTPEPIHIPDDDIESSDSDTDSEREVEANIFTGAEGEAGDDVVVPSSSESTSSDSDTSDSEVEDEAPHPKAGISLDLDDLDEESMGPAVTSDNPLRTKNEIPEADVVIPEVDEVGPLEVLEKVGDIMSIVGQVVIVKGTASHVMNRASEKALDSDTLLVFEDRKVLGYVYETFGPTHQPLYQVKFNQQYPLDPEKVKVGREVFHVPARSKFVFVSQIKHLKGSDASNAYDEEPGEDELEFSDDEEEQAYKRTLQQKYVDRSAAASRHSTPVPSQLRDQDMAEDLYNADPYGAYNDMDFGAGPSRPAPMPYDDPYSDMYGAADVPAASTSSVQSRDNTAQAQDLYQRKERGQTLAVPPRRDGRGRGRGRGRGIDRGRGRVRGRGDFHNPESRGRPPSADHDAQSQRSLSPTSLAIARATGQFSNGTYASDLSGRWEQTPYPPQQPSFNFGHGFQPQYVQPHINPRFASAFGMSFGMMPQYLP